MLILILLWIVSWIARKPLNRFQKGLARQGESAGKAGGEEAKRAETLTHLRRQLVRVTLLLIGALVILKGRIKTWPVHQWQVGRELLRRVKKGLRRRGHRGPPPPSARSTCGPSAGPLNGAWRIRRGKARWTTRASRVG